MGRLLFSLTTVVVLALLAGALWMARQQWMVYEWDEVHETTPGRDRMAENGGTLSLDEILRHLSLPPESRILEVEREQDGGRLYYEIDFLLPDGRIEEVKVDPFTAEVVEREYEGRED